MSLPEPPLPPAKTKWFVWPAIINLSILVYLRFVSHWETEGEVFAIFVLAIVNGVAAALMAVFKKKLPYAPAFLVAGLLLLLVGLGVCAIVVSNTKKPIFNI